MALFLLATVSEALSRHRDKASTGLLRHTDLPPLCTDQRENHITHKHSKILVFICSPLLAESDQKDCFSTATESEFIVIIIFNGKQFSLQGKI